MLIDSTDQPTNVASVPVSATGFPLPPQPKTPLNRQFPKALLVLIALLVLAGILVLVLRPQITKQIEKLKPAESVKSSTYTDKDAYIPQYFKDSEVPLYPKADVKVLTDGDTGYSLMLKSSDKYATVRKFYLDKLAEGGWKTEIAQELDSTVTLVATKDKKHVSLNITKNLVYQEVKKDSPQRKVVEGDTTISISINKI